MRLIADNVRCRVSGEQPELDWLHDRLAIANPAARWSGGDYMYRYYNPSWGSFPTGHVALVLTMARKAGIEVELCDHRRRPCEPDMGADLSWLHDHQVDGVERLIRRTRGIVWAPTASGKTEVAAGLGRLLPCKWLFVAHRTQLAMQAAERFELRTGEEAGLVLGGRWEPARFTCATFQTLYAGIKRGDRKVIALLQSVDGLICDEAHVLPAKTFWKVVSACRRAYWRVGLTGTPMSSGDHRAMMVCGGLGPIVQRITVADMVAKGMVAKPRVVMISMMQRGHSKESWREAYSSMVVHGLHRNATMAMAAKHLEKPVMVFVREIAHGEEVLAAVRHLGLRAEFAQGAWPVAERQRACNDLCDGTLDVLVSTTVMQEGVDVPAVRSVVIGTGGAAATAIVQMMGRAMRTDKGKKESCTIVDFFDRGNKHVLKHARARQQAYIDEGHDVEMLAAVEKLEQLGHVSEPPEQAALQL